MDFIRDISDFISCHQLLNKKKPVLVALSGGADSVALLSVLTDLGYHCEAAHCNFHLRGDEADHDERFAVNLCDKLGVMLHVAHFDVDSHKKAHGVSTEMACRELRYEWFETLRKERGCQAIAVGHHADDNIETVILNMLRGTGIHGMAGIKPRNNHVVRPFLETTRKQILEYLDNKGQTFVTDSTNSENDFKRNWVRNVVLPTIYGRYPHAQSTLMGTIHKMAQCDSLYRELVNRAANDILHYTQDGHVINGHKLLQIENCTQLLFEITRSFGFNHEQCADAITALRQGFSSGKKFFSCSHIMALNRENIEVSPLKETPEKEYHIDLNSRESQNAANIVAERITDAPFTPTRCNGTTAVAFNKKLLECESLIIRHWRQGDRFRPFGMKGSKLVSDLFADLKMGEREKRDTWLLVADGQIVWVVGRRAAQAFTVERDATDYLLLKLATRD